MAERLSIALPLLVVGIYVGGCEGSLTRPRPSRQEYIARFLEYFDDANIEQLEFTYDGAIGGERTIGRVKFKSRVTLKEPLVRVRIQAGRLARITYDPALMNDLASVLQFHDEWEFEAGGTTPAWFDFPFDRPLRGFRETDADERGRKIWYIDDHRNTVYVRAVRG